MGAKKLYAVWDHEKPLGEHTCQEIAGILKMRRENVSGYACTGMLYKGRYSFEVVGEESGKTRKEPLLKEWDEVRLRILTAGR